MKPLPLLTASLLLAAPGVPLHAASVFRDFVQVHGDQLVDGGKPFRFLSFNIPNLHLVEDNVAYDKAILCWETGNELQSPAPWTREIAA